MLKRLETPLVQGSTDTGDLSAHHTQVARFRPPFADFYYVLSLWILPISSYGWFFRIWEFPAAESLLTPLFVGTLPISLEL